MGREQQVTQERYLTTTEAARRIGVSRYTILRAAQQGEIAVALRMPGGSFRLRSADVDTYSQRLAAHARTGEGLLEVRQGHSFRCLFTDGLRPMYIYDLTTLRFLAVNDAAIEHYGYTRDEFLAMRLTDIQPPEEATRPRRLLPPLTSETWQRAGEWKQCLKDGSDITVEIACYPMRYAGQDAVLIAAQDVTTQRQASAVLRASELRLSMQYAVAQILLRSGAVNEALSALLRTICECMRWEYGAYWTLHPSGGFLHCHTIWHQPAALLDLFAAHCLEDHFVPGEGLLGRAWATRVPLCVPDVTIDKHFRRAAVAREARLYGAVWIPLVTSEAIFGVIEFFSSTAQTPDRGLIQALADMGALIGAFIERTQHVQARS